MSLSKSHGGESQPLSAEELILLRTLQDRALRSKASHMSFAPPAMCHGEGFSAGLPHASETSSEWSQVDGGAMADSSKRRLEPDVAPAYAGTFPVSHMPVPESLETVPMPNEAQTFGKTKKGIIISLPPGVENITMWGKTLIEFGKYGNKDMNYEKLTLSTDKDSMSYCKWCKSQVDAAEGRLKDLALFLWAYDFVTGHADQRPVFPGTNDVRRFKGD